MPRGKTFVLFIVIMIFGSSFTGLLVENNVIAQAPAVSVSAMRNAFPESAEWMLAMPCLPVTMRSVTTATHPEVPR